MKSKLYKTVSQFLGSMLCTNISLTYAVLYAVLTNNVVPASDLVYTISYKLCIWCVLCSINCVYTEGDT